MVGQARLPQAFSDRALRDAGVAMAYSSDWPITDINQMRGIQAAMTRPKLSPD